MDKIFGFLNIQTMARALYKCMLFVIVFGFFFDWYMLGYFHIDYKIVEIMTGNWNELMVRPAISAVIFTLLSYVVIRFVYELLQKIDDSVNLDEDDKDKRVCLMILALIIVLECATRSGSFGTVIRANGMYHKIAELTAFLLMINFLGGGKKSHEFEA